MESFWFIAVVVGPVLLIGLIIYATTRNRSAPRENVEQAERGARELREKLAREDEN